MLWLYHKVRKILGLWRSHQAKTFKIIPTSLFSCIDFFYKKISNNAFAVRLSLPSLLDFIFICWPVEIMDMLFSEEIFWGAHVIRFGAWSRAQVYFRFGPKSFVAQDWRPWVVTWTSMFGPNSVDNWAFRLG